MSFDVSFSATKCHFGDILPITCTEETTPNGPTQTKPNMH